MLRKKSNRRGGFTLVELMVVVAIIAILAAIAVPDLLRSVKRSKATLTLDICRQLEAARIQWVAENRVSATTPLDASELAKYIRRGTRLETELLSGGAYDALGTPITLPTFSTPPKVAGSTIMEFSDVVDSSTFWGAYQ